MYLPSLLAGTPLLIKRTTAESGKERRKAYETSHQCHTKALTWLLYPLGSYILRNFRFERQKGYQREQTECEMRRIRQGKKKKCLQPSIPKWTWVPEKPTYLWDLRRCIPILHNHDLIKISWSLSHAANTHFVFTPSVQDDPFLTSTHCQVINALINHASV